MAKKRYEVHTALRPGCSVSWRVGPVDAPDTLRVGVLVGVHGDRAEVRATDAMGYCWVDLDKLDGAHRQPAVVRLVPDLNPAQELPAPVATTLELLAVLDQGVEVTAGAHTTMGLVLTQLQERGYITERSPRSGVWDLTKKAKEVLNA